MMIQRPRRERLPAPGHRDRKVQNVMVVLDAERIVDDTLPLVLEQRAHAVQVRGRLGHVAAVQGRDAVDVGKGVDQAGHLCPVPDARAPVCSRLKIDVVRRSTGHPGVDVPSCLDREIEFRRASVIRHLARDQLQFRFHQRPWKSDHLTVVVDNGAGGSKEFARLFVIDLHAGLFQDSQ